MKRGSNKFLHVSFFVSAVLCLFLSNTHSQDIIRNALTLELTFGAENLPDEYLLARPGDVAVDNDNNIYVIDEMRIKVFDADGRPKAIFGSPGQGPGEFEESIGSVTVSQYGFVSVHNGGVFHSRGFNIYGPDCRFLEISHENKYALMGFHSSGTTKIYTLSRDEYVGVSKRSYIKDDLIMTSEILEYYNGGSKYEIAGYDKHEAVVTKDLRSGINYNGRFLWDCLPDKSVVYTHSRLDEVHTTERSFYQLHLIDLRNMERNVIEHQFEPRPIEIREYHGTDENASALMKEMMKNVSTRKEAYDRKNKILKTFKYVDPLRRIYADGYFVFAVTRESNAEEEILVDVFDCENMVYLASVCFPPKSRFKEIRNGYVYDVGENEEGFPVIEKYRIDPTVYSK
ncbi:hypothetical protein ACFL6L_00730 [candidate division KSB1 bacterium]